MFEGQTEKPQPVSLETAFEELSVQAFACWIRIMTIPGWELTLGRNHIADKLSISVRRLSRYLHELSDKGYLRMIKRPGLPTHLFIVLAPILIAPNHFISFS